MLNTEIINILFYVYFSILAVNCQYCVLIYDWHINNLVCGGFWYIH